MPRPPGMARFPIIFGRFSPISGWTVLHQGHDFALSRRGAPEVCIGFTLEKGGRRECRVRAAPAVSCAKKCGVRARAYRLSGGTRHPLRNGFTAYAALSLVTGLVCHYRLRIEFANLTPASGRQDHTTSPSVSGALVRSAIHVHRIPPRVRDDRETPLRGTGRLESIKLFLPNGEAKYFSRQG